MIFVEARNNIRSPKGINRLHLANHTGWRETCHQANEVGHTLLAQLSEGREIRNFVRGRGIGQASVQYRLVGLDHVIERTTAPGLSICPLSGASIRHYFGLCCSAVPTKGAAFIDGMESVNQNYRPRQGHTHLHETLTEPSNYFSLT